MAFLTSDCTPERIQSMSTEDDRQFAFEEFFRSFVIKIHCDCLVEKDETKQLPLFYPHHDFLRVHSKNNAKSSEAASEDPDPAGEKPLPRKKQSVGNVKKVKQDAKNSYSKGLLSCLGTFFLLIDAQKQGNGLLTFLLQKKLHKSIQQSGHKNYAVSLLSYKHTVLAHPNAQFSHQFMWNTSAGRKGPGNKFPRDQKVEHLNRFLKDSFRSLGPNLNPLTARRINNSSDFGIKIEEKLTEFFELSQAGKSHSQKDHTVTVSKILGILRSESVTDMIPGRKFKGPNLQPNFFANFDEVKFRTWHFDKDKELYRSSKRYRS